MQFTLTGFSEDVGFRVFAFEGITVDRTRIEFLVRTDLGLIRQYGIRIQELPLLCRGLLERCHEDGTRRTLTFTADEMRVHASNCAAERAAASEKRSSRRAPAKQSGGGGWRASQPQ